MKRIILSLALIFVLLLSACSGLAADGPGGEMNFDGQILEIYDGGVLVEPVEGEDIRSSSDKISFSTDELDDIGAQMGDTVTVRYSGEVMESYPAQVIALGWSISEKGVSVSDIPEPESEAVEYSHGDVYMSLDLPGGWSSEIIPAAEEEAENEIFGIRFWPEASPEFALMLEYHTGGIGICGTGVTFTETEFQSGLKATACTEELGDDGYWFFLIYDEPHVKYAVSYSGDRELWSEYEDAVTAILDTVALGYGT